MTANNHPTKSLPELRLALAKAFFTHVPFDGWSKTALVRAGEDLQLPEPEVFRIFPGGHKEIAGFWSNHLDSVLVTEYAGAIQEIQGIRNKVAFATKMRISLMEPDKEAFRRGLAYLLLPDRAVVASQALWKTADRIWYLVGDTSTDYNFYTKRLLLYGVLKSTLVFWLADETEGSARTWRFMENRLDDVLALGKKFGGTVKSLLSLPDRMVESRMGITRASKRSFPFGRR